MKVENDAWKQILIINPKIIMVYKFERLGGRAFQWQTQFPNKNSQAYHINTFHLISNFYSTGLQELKFNFLSSREKYVRDNRKI
jgi:hypothetical protein